MENIIFYRFFFNLAYLLNNTSNEIFSNSFSKIQPLMGLKRKKRGKNGSTFSRSKTLNKLYLIVFSCIISESLQLNLLKFVIHVLSWVKKR